MCELTKKCKACLEEKCITEFNKSKENRDGRVGKCKLCQKNKVPIPSKESIVLTDSQKCCSKCKTIRDKTEFVKDKHRPDGLSTNCKICRKKNSDHIKNQKKVIPIYKNCSKCKLNLPKENFSKESESYTGLSSHCKDCQKKSYLLRLETIDYKIVNEKICNQCFKTKEITDFSKNIASKDGHAATCKVCAINYSHQYYEENKEELIKNEKERREKDPEKYKLQAKNYRVRNLEKLKEKEKEYRENNKDKISQKNKEWRENNKEYVAAKKKEYSINNRQKICERERIRKSTDSLHKISCQIRVSLANVFKRSIEGKYKKSKKTEEILGCSILEFLQHIESQFESWMSWENYGSCTNENCSWSLEHIIPVNWAKTEDELYALNHWSNLMPMCFKKNLSKNGKIVSVCNMELNMTVY